jgi:hypothetical protein
MDTPSTLEHSRFHSRLKLIDNSLGWQGIVNGMDMKPGIKGGTVLIAFRFISFQEWPDAQDIVLAVKLDAHLLAKSNWIIIVQYMNFIHLLLIDFLLITKRQNYGFKREGTSLLEDLSNDIKELHA